MAAAVNNYRELLCRDRADQFIGIQFEMLNRLIHFDKLISIEMWPILSRAPETGSHIFGFNNRALIPVNIFYASELFSDLGVEHEMHPARIFISSNHRASGAFMMHYMTDEGSSWIVVYVTVLSYKNINAVHDHDNVRLSQSAAVNNSIAPAWCAAANVNGTDNNKVVMPNPT